MCDVVHRLGLSRRRHRRRLCCHRHGRLPAGYLDYLLHAVALLDMLKPRAGRWQQRGSRGVQLAYPFRLEEFLVSNQFENAHES